MNDGLDNAEGNLICSVSDCIYAGGTQSGDEYIISDLLGTGTFGQVFKCQKSGTKEIVAIKVVKNKPAYYNQGLLEIKLIQTLNSTFDPKNEKFIVRLLDSFEYKGHICLAFELLSISLLDILTQNQFRGLPLHIVHRFLKQVDFVSLYSL